MTRGVAKTWLFEGAEHTTMEIIAMCPAYSEKYVRESLREGCTTRADISRRYEDGMARYRAQMAKKPAIASRPILASTRLSDSTAIPDFRFRMMRL